MLALTEQQEKLWRYLQSCERCPTFDEMKEYMGLHSKSGIHRLVNALETKGYVSRVGDTPYRMARSLVVHKHPQRQLPPLSCYSMEELAAEIDSRLGLIAA